MDTQRRPAIIFRRAALLLVGIVPRGSSRIDTTSRRPPARPFTKREQTRRIAGTMEPAGSDQKRQARRSRVFKAGTIEFAGHAIPCTVRNLSASGAAIEVRTPLWFPDHFTLGIASDGLHRACHIVWREGERIGLAFD